MVTIMKGSGKLYMIDKLDLQPFKNVKVPFGKVGKVMKAVYPKFEVVKAVGGNPFILKIPLN